MAESSNIVTVQCNDEASASTVSSEIAALSGGGTQIVERENLDGTSVSWIVVAMTTVQTLPKILDSVSKLVETLKVRSIEIDGHVLKNPTPADIRTLRKEIRDHPAE